MWYLLDLFDMYSKTEHRRYILCSTSSTSFVIICLFWIWCQGGTKDWESQDLGRSQDLKTMEDVTVFQRRCFLHSGEFWRIKKQNHFWPYVCQQRYGAWCLRDSRDRQKKTTRQMLQNVPFVAWVFFFLFVASRFVCHSMCQNRFFLNQNGGKRCENV